MHDLDLQRYYDKSGDTELSKGYMEENDHGFCVWGVADNSLILIHVYGDGEYWDSWATEKANQLDLDSVAFGTKRSPKAFCKKFGYTVIGYILERKV